MRVPLLLLGVAVVVAGCGSAPGADSPGRPGAVPPGAQAAVVRAVIDGDTLRLVGEGEGPLPAGAVERVRLLGVDTPEVDGFREEECLGPEASAWTQDRLPGGARVQVVADEELRDQYGRVLLHVFDEEGHLNVDLVRAGLAEAALLHPNLLHAEELQAAEDAARAAGRGIWGAC